MELRHPHQEGMMACTELDMQQLTRLYLGVNHDDKEAGAEDPNRRHRQELSGSSANRYCQGCRHLRVFLLDYDGTLTPIVEKPELAVPSGELIEVLSHLCSHPDTLVYIISGRDGPSLERFVGDLPVGLSCEHGRFFRQVGSKKGEWQAIGGQLDLSWKDVLRPVMEKYTRRIPHTFIEEKQTNLTWHYRSANASELDGDGAMSVEALAAQLSSELKALIRGERKQSQLLHQEHEQHYAVEGDLGATIEVKEGKKTVEVRPCGINKGGVVKMILESINSGTGIFAIPNHHPEQQQQQQQQIISATTTAEAASAEVQTPARPDFQVDFILCMGDDETDEDMFRMLSQMRQPSKHVVSCSIGLRAGTTATHFVPHQAQVLPVLRSLAECIR